MIDENEPIPDRIVKHRIKSDIKGLMIDDLDLMIDRDEVKLIYSFQKPRIPHSLLLLSSGNSLN